MTEKNSPTIEIVPYDKHQDEALELKRVFGQLIEEKVAEAMGGPDAIFQPFFATKRMMTEIRKLQSVPDQNKFIHYFERWGCMAGCGATKETTSSQSLGMCHRCYRVISSRLKTIVREHTPKDGENQGFIDTVKLARAALDPSIRLLVAPPEPQQEGRYYNHREAAAAVGIDPKTLRVWLRNGEVSPSIRVTDKKSLWTDADIEELKLLKRKNASQHNSKASRARWEKEKAPELNGIEEGGSK